MSAGAREARPRRVAAAQDFTNGSTINEIWHPIPGLEGYYEASSEGRIRSRDRLILHRGRGLQLRHGAILKQQHSCGYLNITLFGKTYRVHQLVARAFHGPQPSGTWVLHHNDIRQDNRADNLYFGSPSQNVQDAIRNGRRRSHAHHGAYVVIEDNVEFVGAVES